jgi:hypothetical protein
MSSSKKRNQSDREPVAFHEAGHIVAAFDQDLRVDFSTIIPSGYRKGHVRPSGRMVPKGHLLRTFVETEIIILLAGPAAEQMFIGMDVGVKADDLKVQEFLEAINSDHEVADAHLRYLMMRVNRILTHSWDLVAAFAKQLLTLGSLDQDEIVKVAVDAGWELPPSWKSDKDEELDRELQAFLARGETDIARAFVNGWNAGRFMKFSDTKQSEP